MKMLLTVVLATFGWLANAQSVQTETVGTVSLDCREPGPWKFEMTPVHVTDGVDTVTVKMKADAEALPPKFVIRWQVPQRDTHHLWTSESTHYGVPWSEEMKSELTSWMPIYAFLDANDHNRFTFSCTEACRTVVFKAPINEGGLDFQCRWTFFSVPDAPLREYEVTLRFDTRDIFYARTLGDASDWICAAGGEPMPAPDAAFDALYSTWYVWHQDLSAKEVEEECARAVKLGMKTVIVDDGWQIDLPIGNRPWTGYRFCGDWKAGRNFPDMAEHVRRVQAMGLKYMLWYSVPFVGEKSANYERFAGKYLPVTCAGGHTLDPRFPEVREFIISTYEKAVREWNLDGFKLDFIGRFTLKPGMVDPAIAENYRGRDIKSIPVAVDTMLTEAMRRLKALKPDILIEFRQCYVGPAIRRFGNMLRATDCPCSMVENRTRTTRIRLTAGKTAVHSDMLEWRRDETPESAARCILNAIFSVVQYSNHLGKMPQRQRDMMAHWLGFAEAHKEALVKGDFRPRYPANDYPLLEGESAAERIIGVYQENLAVDVGAADKPVYVLNAANSEFLNVLVPQTPAKIELFDTFGKPVTAPGLKPGLNRIKMPLAGYLKLTWQLPPSKPFRFMTFNLFGAGYGSNGGFKADEREDRAVEVVRRHAPDIVSWQEINAPWWAAKPFTSMDEYTVIRGDEDEALVRAGADLSKRASNWVNHEPLMFRKDRFKLLDSGLDFYHISLQFEKSVTWAVLEDRTDGRRLIAFATHFWWKSNGVESDAIRELNVRHVLNRIETIRAKWGDLPVVGGGDLNCVQGSLALKTFADNGYDEAGEVAPVRSTVPSEHGALTRDAEGKCHGEVGVIGKEGCAMIDHIYFTKGAFQALKHDVVTDEDAINISDHSPVWADLKQVK